VAEQEKVIKRLSMSAEKSNTKSEKSASKNAELKKTHKFEREAMEKKHKEDMAVTLANAENEHEKEIKRWRSASCVRSTCSTQR
jgi:hypothetical protein